MSVSGHSRNSNTPGQAAGSVFRQRILAYVWFSVTAAVMARTYLKWLHDDEGRKIISLDYCYFKNLGHLTASFPCQTQRRPSCLLRTCAELTRWANRSICRWQNLKLPTSSEQRRGPLLAGLWLLLPRLRSPDKEGGNGLETQAAHCLLRCNE